MPDEEIQEEEGTVEEGTEEGQGEGEEQETPPRLLPEDVLPEELRGRSPEETKHLLSTVLDTMKYQGQLLDQARRQPAHPMEPGAEGKAAEPPNYKEALWDDPEKVILDVVERKYGMDFNTLQERATSGVYAEVRDRHPDFQKYEGRVKARLREAGIPAGQITPETIEFTYYAERGIDVAQAETRKRNAAPKSESPSPRSSQPVKKEYEFESDLERDIFKQSGLSMEEYLELKNPEPMEVPTTPEGR